MDAQQVVEGGGGINECCAGGIIVLNWWLSVFLDVLQQGLPGFTEVESPISVDVNPSCRYVALEWVQPLPEMCTRDTSSG